MTDKKEKTLVEIKNDGSGSGYGCALVLIAIEILLHFGQILKVIEVAISCQK
jgi:hypothetical protein